MRRPVVLYPDVESAVVAYLRPELPAGWAVSNRDSGEQRHVWVRDDGGPNATPVTRVARLGINVFGVSPEVAGRDEAVDVANLLRAVLSAAPGDGPFTDADGFGGPIAVSDERGRATFYLTCELHVRGEHHTIGA